MLLKKLGHSGEIPLTQQQKRNSLDAGHQNNEKKLIKNDCFGDYAGADLKKKALPRHLDSDKKKPLPGLGVVSTPKYHEGKAVYISESDI